MFGQLLATICIIMVSAHAWMIRNTTEWSLSRRFSAWLDILRYDRDRDDPVTTRLKQVRLEHFNTAKTWGANILGMAMLVAMFTKPFSRLFAGSSDAKSNTLMVFGLTLYAILLILKNTSWPVTSRWRSVGYSAIVTSVALRMASCQQDPSFFILLPLDYLMLTLTSWFILDIRLAVLGNGLCSLVCCLSYSRNAQAFRQDLMWANNDILFWFWTAIMFVFSTGFAAAAEHWVRAQIRAELEAQELKSAMHRILCAFCDAHVYLDAELRILSPDRRLQHLICGDSATAKLEGTSFLSLVTDTSREQFGKLVSADKPYSATLGSVADAINVELCSFEGRKVDAVICHTSVSDMAKPSVHFLAIRCKMVEVPELDEDEMSFDNATPSVANHRYAAAGGAGDDDHALDAPVSEQSLGFGGFEDESSSQGWICQRCLATGTDWGDRMSVNSAQTLRTFMGSQSTGQRSHSPRGPAPIPSGDALDCLASLTEWGGNTARRLMGQTAQSHNVVCMASDILEEKVALDEAMDQICFLQLVGKKLMPSSSTLECAWGHVIHMVTGLCPTKLTFTASSTIKRWAPPSFQPAEQWVPWWELEPAQHQLHRDVVALVMRRTQHRQRRS
eukprot:TRINITY_DN63517_c0_g1_i1.p1 TRINITY_DN63517_c0_g1~~TRINITY_DN63517_c0_g1_i1.p1  ORF type:complete len:617 (+),score=79.69 TRINITY_DN63517_c0_g1_i1:98-1948(+)